MEGSKKNERALTRRVGRMGSALDLGAFKKFLREDDYAIDVLDNKSEEAIVAIRNTDPVHSKLEDQLTNETLRKLEETFEEADVDGGGGLDMEEFRFAMRKTLGEHLTDQELDMMFMKVDTNCDGTVDWDEYLGYTLLEYSEKDRMNVLARSCPFPETSQPVSDLGHVQRHFDSFVNILSAPSAKKYDNVYRPLDENDCPGRYVTVSKDGVVNFWSMDLKHLKRFQLERKERGSIWVTAATIMPNTNMLAIATTSSCILFYELSMQVNKFVLVMTDLDIAVTAMDYWYDPISLDYSLLMWGDLRGNVNIMTIRASDSTCPLSPSSAGRRGEKISIDQVQLGIIHGLSLFKIPKAHGDQVLEIHYCPTLEMFMSCSRDKATALIKSDIKFQRPTYFQQNKGIFSFDFSPKHNFIVTGGKDTIVRVWTPFIVVKPVMIFHGHKEAVTFVRIHDELEHVISISKGKDILIFDLNTQTCIQSIYKKFVNLGTQPLSGCYFNQKRRALLLASNRFVIVQHKGEEWRSSQPFSHTLPVSCVMFNPLFNQVVSCGLDSNVMVWDVTNGEKVMQFTAHQEYVYGEERLIPITAMCFDSTQRRLATGARNGAIKLWNFNNGACLREVDEGSLANQEVTALAWPLNRLLAVGWSQRLVCYMDSEEDEAITYYQKFHIDDIVAMVFKEPSTLATASFDGDIFLWCLDTFKPTVHFNIAQSLKAQSCRRLIYNLKNTVGSDNLSDDVSAFGDGANSEDSTEVCSSTDIMARSHGKGDIEIVAEKSEQPLLAAQQQGLHVFPCLKKLPPIKTGKGSEESCRQKSEHFNGTSSCSAQDVVSPHTVCDQVITHLVEEKIHSKSDKHKFIPSEVGPKEGQKLMDQWYLNKVLFLQSRANTKDTATLVSAGSRGWITFWSVHHSGGVKGVFNSAHFVGSDINALATDPDNKLLIAGDGKGYLKVWHIAAYCTQRRDSYLTEFELIEQFPFLKIQSSLKKKIESQSRHGLPPFRVSSDLFKAPMLLTSVRAHLKEITQLDFIPENDVVISSSADCSIRMHTVSGQFIGIFGVEDSWKYKPFLENNKDNHTPKSSWQGGSEFPGIVSLVNKNFPPDIRRVASATTLKVWYRGISPLYNLVKNIIMVWVPMLRALQSRRRLNEPLPSKEDERPTKNLPIEREGPKKEREVILGHHVKIPRKHKPLPAICKPRMQATQCAVYSSLPCYTLTEVSREYTPPPMILEMQERNNAVLPKHPHRRRSDLFSKRRSHANKPRAVNRRQGRPQDHPLQKIPEKAPS